jgi:hypothetical protein
MANNILSNLPPGVQLPTPAPAAMLHTWLQPKQLSDASQPGSIMGQSAIDQIGFYGKSTGVVQPIGDGGTPGAYTYTLAAITAALKAEGLIAT